MSLKTYYNSTRMICYILHHNLQRTYVCFPVRATTFQSCFVPPGECWDRTFREIITETFKPLSIQNVIIFQSYSIPRNLCTLNSADLRIRVQHKIRSRTIVYARIHFILNAK